MWDNEGGSDDVARRIPCGIGREHMEEGNQRRKEWTRSCEIITHAKQLTCTSEAPSHHRLSSPVGGAHGGLSAYSGGRLSARRCSHVARDGRAGELCVSAVVADAGTGSLPLSGDKGEHAWPTARRRRDDAC